MRYVYLDSGMSVRYEKRPKCHTRQIEVLTQGHSPERGNGCKNTRCYSGTRVRHWYISKCPTQLIFLKKKKIDFGLKLGIEVFIPMPKRVKDQPCVLDMKRRVGVT